MKNLAVMAIPSRDDYVWNLSSEKVPHLTLLYLGDQPDTMDTRRMEEFIQHVVDTTLYPFGMSVDRRGELGDKNADVLYFSGHNVQFLENFRHFLLTNEEIYQAYHSTDQHQNWTPHLTLGYPEKPARPDKREYPGVHWVSFDRIAFWTGNYEGVEFPLKNQASDIAMSTEEKGERFVRHFGVKGMKWGVVREGAKTLAIGSDDHVKANVVKVKAMVAGVHTLTNKDLNTIIKRMDLEVKFKELKTIKHKQSLLGKGASWAGRVATDILVTSVSSWFKAPWSRGGSSSRPSSGGFNGRVINGSIVPQRSVGS
jgi:2'-5' RNA ligase